jgi:hypothetical protein
MMKPVDFCKDSKTFKENFEQVGIGWERQYGEEGFNLGVNKEVPVGKKLLLLKNKSTTPKAPKYILWMEK